MSQVEKITAYAQRINAGEVLTSEEYAELAEMLNQHNTRLRAVRVAKRLAANPTLDAILLLLAAEIAKNVCEDFDLAASVYHVVGNVLRDELPEILAELTNRSIAECTVAVRSTLD